MMGVRRGGLCLKKQNLLILLTIVVVVSVLIATIMLPPKVYSYHHRERGITALVTTLSLNGSEVEELNITSLQEKLNDSGFRVMAINYTENYRAYSISSPAPWDNSQWNENWAIHAQKISGAWNASLDIFYFIGCSESELDAQKQYIVDRTNRLAEICGLEIDWTNVQWSVWYTDE